MENKNVICPIYFEDHTFGGHVGSIENFTNMDLGIVRTTFLNGRPYFSATDLCRGLCLNPENTGVFVNEAVNDILSGYYDMNTPTFSNGRGVSYRENPNNNTPLTRIGGCLDMNTPGISNTTVLSMDPEELYFYISIDVSHHIGNSDKIVTQKVNTLFVSEPVLYMLTFRSRKKEALAFKAWLAMEVLPNLRLLGASGTANMIGNEYTNIVNALEKIDDIYNNIKDYDTKKSMFCSTLQDIVLDQKIEINSMAQLQDIVASLVYKLQGISCTEDFILGNTNILNDNINILNEKVTNIASGLNYVFGQH